jgi:maltose alpha-D-glucosyltransferase / alpha-amylase
VPSLASAEQSNTSVVFSDRYILKLFRRPSEGINPDLELGRFLTERAAFPHTPPTLGSLEYRAGRAEPLTLAILQGYVPNEGDAWQYTLRHLGQYFEQILTHPGELKEAPIPPGLPLTLSGQAIPELAEETIGPYLESARLLGERTAELHVALASDALDPAVAPEPFSTLYLRALYQSMRGQARRALWLLTKRRNDLPGPLGALAEKVLASEAEILQVFWAVVERKVDATRIRCHGDLHLGQVLYTGKDFVFIDFEGEPARPIGERRIKRSPLKDVAGMLRSFDYAAQTGLLEALASGVAQPDDLARLEPWARYWSSWVAATYLKAYFATAGEASFLPRDPAGQETLLQAHVLEKAVYELAYELNNRPSWVKIPLAGILQLLEAR